jgi:two-component system phosphate regulon sensor histidine kinase PhoR
MSTGRRLPTAGIRAKLFLASLALTAVSVAATDAFVTRRMDSELTQRIRADLLVRLALAEREVSAAHLPMERVPEWKALVDDLGQRSQARVTVIRRDGLVLADSDVTWAGLAQTENHATRPEVVEALATGTGAHQRVSATVQRRMMYVAMPMKRDGDVVGIARLAVPLVEVDAAIARLGRAVSLASTVGLAFAVVLAMMVAHAMSRRVRRLTEVARKMADGDLERRAEVRGNDELAALGAALNQLVSHQATTLSQLRSERDVVGHVLEAMREGVLVLDAQGRLALVNPALRDMLLLGSDTVGKTPLEATRNADLVRALTEAASGAGVAELVVGGLKPRRLLVNAGPLPGEEGGLVAVFVDVTEMRQLETMRRDFAANVSHELRTPLAAVAAATETLQGGALNDPRSAREFVGMIERNVLRLQRLLEDVLELSRIEAREFRLDLESLELEPEATRVLGLFEHRVVKKRIRVVTELPKDLGRVVADRRALEHILSNLIDNAVKYCQDGASITLRAAPEGPVVRISVIDTGPGIERKHLPRLFERFYRVDPGRSRDVGGTGLGLSIVKHLAEAMGGGVSVESSVGSGTTFTVTLPRA